MPNERGMKEKKHRRTINKTRKQNKQQTNEQKAEIVTVTEMYDKPLQ